MLTGFERQHCELSVQNLNLTVFNMYLHRNLKKKITSSDICGFSVGSKFYHE